MCGWTPPVFELHGSQSIPGPLVSPGMFMQLYKKHTQADWTVIYVDGHCCYDGPLTLQKMRGTARLP